MKLIIPLLLLLPLAVSADKSDDLFKENQEGTSYIQSFRMDCSSASPLCTERKEALRMEDRFNEILASALSRNIHLWPNNEIIRVEAALDLRKTGDNFFSNQFFGRASDNYQEATKIIFDTLEEADVTVSELIELGEQYLYEDGKPDWAAPYFNDAAPYDPGNQRIINGLSRIRFLRSFEEDVKSIEDLLLTGSYDEALSLIDETMMGDPGNKELSDLRERATQAAETIEINNLIIDLNSKSDDLSLEEKKEKLTKIENSISLYGAENLGQEIQDSKKKLEGQIYTEEISELKKIFINNPSEEIETTYQKAKMLNRLYPNKKEIEELLSQITTTRNKLRLDDLKISADDLKADEEWVKARNVLKEVSMVEESQSVSKEISDIETIISLLEEIKKIDDNSSNYLKNQKDINSSKSLSKKLKGYSNNSTPKLNKTLIEFDNLIGQYQSLVTEAEKRKKEKSVAPRRKSSESRPKTVAETKKSSENQGGKQRSEENNIQGTFRKASLNMASFSKAVKCTKRIRNKKFSALFEVSLSSTGRPIEVVLINEEELNTSSRATRDALDVVKNALIKSRYYPAQAGDVYVESVLTQRLAIPATFCQG